MHYKAGGEGLMDHTDILIIGAGVVGLAVAAELGSACPGKSIALFERNEKFGQEISSRNSEVVHSGIYYPRGSLKAQLCVRGNQLLYAFCEKHKIPHRRLGKLIVAIEETDLLSLEELKRKAELNGVQGVELLKPGQVRELEPEIRTRGALLVPSAGIVDSYLLMRRLEDLALQSGVLPAYCHEVIGIESSGKDYRVQFSNPDGSIDQIGCSILINCAGLNAHNIAAMFSIGPDREGYRIYPCKGEYFSVSFSKSKLVNRLVYPPPLEELRGLGIHLTKNLDGRLRLGPSAFYVDQIDYSVNPGNLDYFFRAVKDFLPFLEPADLEPEMAGIRPKLQGPEDSFRDFIIRHEADRGLPGIINLVGIESPGLTCCFSIAEMVGEIAEGLSK